MSTIFVENIFNMTSRQFWDKTFPILRNKYILSLLVFGVWIFLFDQNNLLDRFSEKKKLDQLKQEQEYYSNKIKEDQRRMKELETDRDNLEKFAREQYLMKRANEDIFVIIEEE